MMKQCNICDKAFKPYRSTSLTCSKKCSKINAKNLQKTWKSKNKEHILEYTKKWYFKNKKLKNLKSKEYYQNNKAAVDAYQNEYRKDRRKTDLQYRLSCDIRAHLSSRVRNGGSISNLSCSIEELKAHLESQFKDNMTWDNYGFYGWHIDHIKPLASFDLTKEEELKKACHYTNLQPLWAEENLSKGASHA